MAKNGPSLTTDNPPKNFRPLISKENLSKLNENKVNFSFEYYRQREFFGFNRGVDIKWFAGLLERLQEYSMHNKEYFIREASAIKGLRYHEIDWDAKNIPIKKSDINWIPEHYVLNQEDYAFVQMAISQANGRIVGFWDESRPTFNVVFLDPLHNIQPAGGKYGHKVNSCSALPSRYDYLLHQITTVKREANCPDTDQCVLLSKLDEEVDAHGIVYVDLDRDFYAAYIDKINKYTLQELLEYAILEYDKNN